MDCSALQAERNRDSEHGDANLRSLGFKPIMSINNGWIGNLKKARGTNPSDSLSMAFTEFHHDGTHATSEGRTVCLLFPLDQAPHTGIDNAF